MDLMEMLTGELGQLVHSPFIQVSLGVLIYAIGYITGKLELKKLVDPPYKK